MAQMPNIVDPATAFRRTLGPALVNGGVETRLVICVSRATTDGRELNRPEKICCVFGRIERTGGIILWAHPLTGCQTF